MQNENTDESVIKFRDQAIRRALETPHRPVKKKDDAAKSDAKKVKFSGRKPVRQAPEKA